MKKTPETKPKGPILVRSPEGVKTFWMGDDFRVWREAPNVVEVANAYRVTRMSLAQVKEVIDAFEAVVRAKP